MKKYLVLFILFFFLKPLFSQQVKILFDATKAESAGNADWVIDADLHNIGYQNGPPVVGQGDESNPQKLPTPSQSNVTQSTQEDFWEGGISAWGIELVKKGYWVETLPYNGQITYGNSANQQDLSNYKVFIVCEPNIKFTSAEKTAIMYFVQDGGGLFLVSDHDNSDRNGDGWDSPHILNDFMNSNGVQANPFGMTFDYDDFSQTTTNIPYLPGDPLLHGIMGNVTMAQWFNGTSLTLSPSNNSSVKGVIYKTGSPFGNSNVMVAYATYGNGRVVGFGDSSPCDDGSGDPNDQLYDGWLAAANGNHRLLIINATIWLASSTATSIPALNDQENDISVFPNPATTEITVTIDPGIPVSGTTFSLYSINGKEVIKIRNFRSHEFKFGTSELSHGLYFYRLACESDIMKYGKIIIE
jgi:hypothetical protein